MKKLIIMFPLVILLLSGCIRVEDPKDTNNEGTTTDTLSTVNIESNQTAFMVKWQKNTKGYGQLEITNNTAVVKNVVAIVSAGTKGVSLSCNYTGEGNGVKNYSCETTNADKIGSFPMSFPPEQELLVIERAGNTNESGFEVLSQFLIFASHGKE